MLSIASAPLFLVSFLIHCQPDSHETPCIQCFCFSRSPFTSFPAIVLSSSGQQSMHQWLLLTHITQATSHCCTLCLIWIAMSDALFIPKISSKHLSHWKTKTGRKQHVNVAVDVQLWGVIMLHFWIYSLTSSPTMAYILLLLLLLTVSCEENNQNIMKKSMSFTQISINHMGGLVPV